MKVVQQKKFYLKGKPVVGGVIKVNERSYTLLHYIPRVTRRGQKSYFFIWQGTCSACGDMFTFEALRVFWPTATCKVCR